MDKDIVFVTRSLPQHFIGGMEIAAWELAKEISRSNYSVKIITTSINNRSGEFIQDGVKIIALPGTPPGKYSSLWWKKSRQYFLENCINSTHAVLSISAGAYGLLPIKKEFPSIKFILQVHGTSLGEFTSKIQSHRPRQLLGSIKNLLSLPRDLISYNKFDAIVAVGQQVINELQRPPINRIIRPEKIHLISNGINTEIFHPSTECRNSTRDRLKIDERAPILLSASRLHPQKGVENILNTFAEFLSIRKNAILLVAGDGPDRGRLEKKCIEMSIHHSVRFLGSLDPEDLVKIYQASDIFAFLTERIEGLPLNILEAMATGLPVLTSEHLSIFNSDNITKVNPKDFATASKKLAQMLDNRPAEKVNLLPRQYQLSFAAQAYIDLIKTLTPHDSGRP